MFITSKSPEQGENSCNFKVRYFGYKVTKFYSCLQGGSFFYVGYAFSCTTWRKITPGSFLQKNPIVLQQEGGLFYVEKWPGHYYTGVIILFYTVIHLFMVFLLNFSQLFFLLIIKQMNKLIQSSSMQFNTNSTWHMALELKENIHVSHVLHFISKLGAKKPNTEDNRTFHRLMKDIKQFLKNRLNIQTHFYIPVIRL